MNIIYFVPNITIAGGIFRIVSDKMNYLAENMEGRLFLAYYGNGQEKPIYPLHPNIQLLPIDIEWKVGFGKKINRVWKNISIIRHIFKKYKIDIAVNANAPLLIWILPFICRRIKKIHEFHFSYKGQQILDEEIFKSRGKKFLVQYLRKCCLTKFDKVIALTESDKKMWNLPNIFVIPNFSNIQLHERNGRKSKVAISAGRLESVKGYNRLIAAWVIVAQKCPDWQLEIWGDGALKNELSKLINTLGLNNKVLLMGYTNDIISRMLQASGCVLSSLYEGISLVLIEAMSCGLPVISYSCQCGPKDLIEHGKNGFLCEVNDETKLAEYICSIIEDEKLRIKMGQASKKKSEEFRIEKIVTQWTNLFQTLINNKNK